MGTKINFGSDEEFIKKYNELKSATKVGEYYGCTKNPVLSHAKEIGYDINSNKTYKLSLEDKKAIIAAYEVETSTALAKKYGVSRGMITKIWYDANLKGKKRDFSNIGNNLLGQTFGYLTVIDFSDKRNAGGGKYWKCSCSCGRPDCLKEKEILGESLLNGSTISCGAVGKENLEIGQGLNFQDLTGQRFGKLVAIERIEDKILSSNTAATQWKCECDCGRIVNVLSSNLKTGNTQSCGFCGVNSHGNLKIEKLLKENNIIFQREFRFLDCKDCYPLPFDFCAFDKNNNKYLIEYDGEQHTDENSFFYTDKIKKHDRIKSEYCRENNIPLIRIPYTQYNNLRIEDLLLETSSFIEK